MAAIGAKLRSAGDGIVIFHCPGCKTGHMITIARDPNFPGDPCWGFNGNGDAPTFTPSVLVQRETWVPPVTGDNLAEWQVNPWPQSKVKEICHSFVTDGRIQFLSDSTHALAGQTVDLPDWQDIIKGA